MDRLNKTEEPARQVVGFHVEGAQNVAASPSDSEPHRGMQNSSSVPYLPPALSVCNQFMICVLTRVFPVKGILRFSRRQPQLDHLRSDCCHPLRLGELWLIRVQALAHQIWLCDVSLSAVL